MTDELKRYAPPVVRRERVAVTFTKNSRASGSRPNIYTTLSELDRFCEQMELIAAKGLPA